MKIFLLLVLFSNRPDQFPVCSSHRRAMQGFSPHRHLPDDVCWIYRHHSKTRERTSVSISAVWIPEYFERTAERREMCAWVEGCFMRWAMWMFVVYSGWLLVAVRAFITFFRDIFIQSATSLLSFIQSFFFFSSLTLQSVIMFIWA